MHLKWIHNNTFKQHENLFSKWRILCQSVCVKNKKKEAENGGFIELEL